MQNVMPAVANYSQELKEYKAMLDRWKYAFENVSDSKKKKNKSKGRKK